VRVAQPVPDTVKTWAFVDELNHRSFHGRWVYDPASATVAVVGGLDLDALGTADPVGLSAVMVASMLSAAESQVYLSRPQRSLDAGKALTLVGGRRRAHPAPIAGFVGREVVPRGKRPGPATQVLPLLQDCLVPELPCWIVEHDSHQSRAVRGDGTLSLLVRVGVHPAVGHGLMIAVAGAQLDKAEADAHLRLAARNRALCNQPGLAGWTRSEARSELRVFLPNALLQWIDIPAFDLSPVLAQVHTIIDQGQAALTNNKDPDRLRAVLLKPAWPGDEEAAALACRDPINDGEDAPDTLVWFDRLDRPAYTTVASFRRWLEKLTTEDWPTDPLAGSLTGSTVNTSASSRRLERPTTICACTPNRSRNTGVCRQMSKDCRRRLHAATTLRCWT
jgi:hypothetical protein